MVVVELRALAVSTGNSAASETRASPYTANLGNEPVTGPVHPSVAPASDSALHGNYSTLSLANVFVIHSTSWSRADFICLSLSDSP